MYHLCKMSRLYQGHSYCGPTSDGQPTERESLEEAKELAHKFNKRNPVGWEVFDAATGERVYSTGMGF